ncbi:hypothetical protein FE257_007494 [Aspergillus nanangensis]|uniref:ER-bound oxygenase mpaB/mpaB'/Rubber oxygenase catalytic domain-containing protein n=1 Tax=Aspergillus nanangensis TaxID=2582783 RepID=A0AAD4CMR3_ASPNN|nr:hypothetical protein FE257_007494 [Aspergillus nanangensis]
MSTSDSEAEKHSEAINLALKNPQHIQRVLREGIILSGGAAAILLQVANPGVGKGVGNHSNFAYRPIDRLRTTMTYVYCMVFGTPQEKKTVIELVHRAHSLVKGADYSADDAHLQLWVAATLYAVGINIYEDVFGRIGEDKGERLYREYAVLATSLRVPPDMWPKDREAFWVYWDEQIASFEICDEAKEVARDLLRNKKLPFYLRAFLPLLRVMTTHQLPPRLREEFSLKDTKGRKGVYKVTMGLTKLTYPLIPSFIRTYPRKYYLKDMRRRIAKAEGKMDKL